MVPRKGYNEAVVRLRCVGKMRLPAQAPEGLPPLRATALYFVFPLVLLFYSYLK